MLVDSEIVPDTCRIVRIRTVPLGPFLYLFVQLREVYRADVLDRVRIAVYEVVAAESDGAFEPISRPSRASSLPAAPCEHGKRFLVRLFKLLFVIHLLYFKILSVKDNAGPNRIRCCHAWLTVHAIQQIFCLSVVRFLTDHPL